MIRAKELKHYPDHLNGVQQLVNAEDYTDAQEGTKLCLAEWQPCHFTIIIYHLGEQCIILRIVTCSDSYDKMNYVSFLVTVKPL